MTSLDDSTRQSTEEDVRRTVTLIEAEAKSRAMWNSFKNYIGIVAAALFAAVLARPDLPKQVHFGAVALSDAIRWYLQVGIVGAFAVQLFLAIYEVVQQQVKVSSFVRRLAFAYLAIGVVLLYSLVNALLS